MSHPFTLQYMQSGESLSNEIGGEIKNSKGGQEETQAYESPMMSSQSAKTCCSEWVTEGCQTDQVEGNPDVEIETIREEMNITITDDKERLSFLKILRMAMNRRMKVFAEEVSLLGLSYLVKPSSYKVGSIIRKVIWTSLLLFGTGFMVFQIYDRISYYMIFPTVVNYRVAYNRSLRFPTVTICSVNMVSKKAFISTGPEAKSIASIHYPPFWDLEFGNDYKTFNLSLNDIDWEFFYSYISAKMKDMILECSFGNLPCDASDAFKNTVPDTEHCLSFNPVTSNYVTTQPGANYGLRLVLWVNESDTCLIASPGAGFVVALHDPRDLLIVNEFGFRLGTGVSTSVSFSLRNLSTLPSPYGDCREAENYTFMRCLRQCLGDFLSSKCGCRSLELDVPGPACSLDRYYSCMPKNIKSFILSGACRKCNCPLHCYQPTYPFSISTSPLSDHFLNYMSQKSQFKGRNLTMSKLSKELVFLDIFYSQLSYVDIQTIPAYDFLTLVCDIGGALGLILGGTLLTIVEFAQLFIQLVNEIVTSARFTRMQRS